MTFSHITHALMMIAVGLATVTPAHADNPPSLVLSVDQAITQALDHNRQLRIAALEINKARSKLRWAGRLDNPILELEGSNDQWGNNEGEDDYQVAFSQSFPLTSKLKDQRELRRVQVILAEAELAEARRTLANEVAQNAITLLAANAQHDLLDKLVSLNNEIVAFLKSGADAGEVSPLDVTQARLNSASLARRISALKIQSIDLEKSLKKLLSLQPDQSLTLQNPPPLPAHPPARFMDADPIFKQRPDYAITLIQNDAAHAEQALAHSERWEDVAIKLFAQREDSLDEPIGLDRNNLFGIGISIPLPFWKKNRQAIDEANIELEAAQQQTAASELFIRLELASALEKRHATYELAEEASGETLQLANENLEAFRAAYETGQATLLQLQRAQEQQLELQTAALELTTDYHLAHAEVQYVTANYPGLQTPTPGSNNLPTTSK